MVTYYSSLVYRSCIHLGLPFLPQSVHSTAHAERIIRGAAGKGKVNPQRAASHPPRAQVNKYTGSQGRRETKERGFPGSAHCAQPQLADRQGWRAWLSRFMAMRETIKFKDSKKSFKNLFLGDRQILPSKFRGKSSELCSMRSKTLNR